MTLTQISLRHWGNSIQTPLIFPDLFNKMIPKKALIQSWKEPSFKCNYKFSTSKKYKNIICASQDILHFVEYLFFL
jgi:hypothetical protein